MDLKPYANYLRAASAMIAGVGVGLLATVLSLNAGYGFNSLRAGPWTAWPHIGGADIDPYARAVISRSGEAPLGRDQGLAFIARADSNGAPLSAECEYRIIDPLPAARFWTIALASPDGRLLANPTERYGYSSVDVLRNEGGAFEIDVAREARPGNWLSPGGAKDFVVMLRLYDTPLDIESAPDPNSFPKIVKLGCA
ncbi:DUF1214 domain-containing protein [Methylocystis sp. FS]|uniref:DUF1214 domain-containing protein n=1 Tax=Methylocystis silviterrae TaxID=2743612 RepID=UPI0015834830|nr:DUF1214 domain-containing protein [Methylocystis silviterrae]NUJ79419.1 DUF1214 domain-containing protein [Methylocystis silviterrae]